MTYWVHQPDGAGELTDMEDTMETFDLTGRCQPMRGGEVHVQHPVYDNRPFPWCRTGAQTNQGTRYASLSPESEVTCTKCARGLAYQASKQTEVVK